MLWPWLWFDPAARFSEYFLRTTQRSIIYVWYFGERYADRDVPWHYPAVLFLATVPVGLQALGLIGLVGGERRPGRERPAQLVLGEMLFPLVLFSLPKVAVYDGERLFLIVFPLWAIMIGRGGALAWTWLRRKCTGRVAAIVAATFLVGQAWGVLADWSCWLSYYNLSLGGLRGADRLGMELDYWGEAVTRDFLEQVVHAVPDGAHVDVTPILLPNDIQLKEMMRQAPVLRRRGIVLHTFREDAAEHSDYLLVFFRRADLSPLIRERVRNTLPLVTSRRSGVLLAALYDRRTF